MGTEIVINSNVILSEARWFACDHLVVEKKISWPRRS